MFIEGFIVDCFSAFLLIFSSSLKITKPSSMLDQMQDFSNTTNYHGNIAEDTHKITDGGGERADQGRGRVD
jgi:hypothetical protein